MLSGIQLLVFVYLISLIHLICYGFGSSCSAASEEQATPSNWFLPTFKFEGKSHFSFGYQLGLKFRSQIQNRLQQNDNLQHVLIPFYQTAHGKNVYSKYLESHTKKFPEYMDEIHGMAKGSMVDFEILFIMNIVEEYGASMHHNPRRTSSTLHCSDIILYNNDHILVAHNEDSSKSDLNHFAIVEAKLGSSPGFKAFVYLGDLPSGAFGQNYAGVAFSLNYVQPAQLLLGGYGRGFVSRNLLDALSLSHAVDIITMKHQAMGHNYQLMYIPERRIFNIEVAPFDRYSIQEIKKSDPPLFHANQYQRLQVRQILSQSSIHRLARAAKLPTPCTLHDVLAILGDQGDSEYPVFHDLLSHKRGDLSNWTMITAVFDLLQMQLYLLHGNPTCFKVVMTWEL